MAVDTMRVRLHLRLIRVLTVLVDTPSRLEVEVASTGAWSRCLFCGFKCRTVHDRASAQDPGPARQRAACDVGVDPAPGSCVPTGDERHLEDHGVFEGALTRRLARQLVADAKVMSIRSVVRRHGLHWHLIMNLVTSWSALTCGRRWWTSPPSGSTRTSLCSWRPPRRHHRLPSLRGRNLGVRPGRLHHRTLRRMVTPPRLPRLARRPPHGRLARINRPGRRTRRTPGLRLLVRRRPETPRTAALRGRIHRSHHVRRDALGRPRRRRRTAPRSPPDRPTRRPPSLRRLHQPRRTHPLQRLHHRRDRPRCLRRPRCARHHHPPTGDRSRPPTRRRQPHPLHLRAPPRTSPAPAPVHRPHRTDRRQDLRPSQPLSRPAHQTAAARHRRGRQHRPSPRPRSDRLHRPRWSASNSSPSGKTSPKSRPATAPSPKP